MPSLELSMGEHKEKKFQIFVQLFKNFWFIVRNKNKKNQKYSKKCDFVTFFENILKKRK
jgi:hypothetical protein